MSGTVVCALPTVGPKSAAKLPSFTRVSQSLPFKVTYSRQGSGGISLPPLPRYKEPVVGVRLWGEDDYVVRKTGFIAPNQRNDFDSCHSVPDVLSSKYEGYMFPKPLSGEISGMVYSSKRTGRHVQRDATFELFPTHNPLRKTDDGNSYVLGQNTRQALSDYITRLYKTSRNNLQMRDTTDFMRRRGDRNKQYKEVCKDSCDVSTCVSVLNHPDPCPYCWAGRRDKEKCQIRAEILPIEDSFGHQTLLNEESDNKPCDQCMATSCNGDKDCLKTNQNVSNELGKTEDQRVTFGEVCNDGSSCLKTDEILSEISLKKSKERNKTKDTMPQGDTSFGPWSGDSAQTDDRVPLLLSHVYNYKLPSSLHNAGTQNEFTHSYMERHGCQLNNDNHINLTPWTLRTEQLSTSQTSENKEETPVSCNGLDKQGHLQKEVMLSETNSWTFRDEKNNLRIPCVSKVIGYKNKTDVHTKIHKDHPEPMPDLRDFKRYSKQVNFFGYNSSVFR